MTDASDTPRTDKECWVPYDTEAGRDMDCEVVDSDFAKQLERELNAELLINAQLQNLLEQLSKRIDKLLTLM